MDPVHTVGFGASSNMDGFRLVHLIGTLAVFSASSLDFSPVSIRLPAYECFHGSFSYGHLLKSQNIPEMHVIPSYS